MRANFYIFYFLIFLYPTTGFSAAAETEDKEVLTKSQIINYEAEYRRWETFIDRIGEVSLENREAELEKAANRLDYIRRLLKSEREPVTPEPEGKKRTPSAFTVVSDNIVEARYDLKMGRTIPDIL